VEDCAYAVMLVANSSYGDLNRPRCGSGRWREMRGDQPFFSSIVTVSLAHFIRNLDKSMLVRLLEPGP
jgi:hypothetical protein